jgi:hypothetical protein
MTFSLSTIDWNALATIISSLVLVGVIATLLEMRKQRSYTYRPLLAVAQKQFVIQRNENGIPTVWKETYEHSQDTYQLPFYFNLQNIGFASAHDVEIRWKVDIAELEKKLSKYLSNPLLLTKIDYKDSPSNYFFHYNNHCYGFSLNGADYMERTAVVHKGSNYKMKLPQGLQSFLSFYTYLYFMEKKQSRLELTLDITIELEMNYKDLSNKHKNQSLNVKIWMYILGRFGINKENILIGRFEFI